MAWQTGEAMSCPSRESPRPSLPVWPLRQQSVIATDRTYWCSCATEKPLSQPGTASHTTESSGERELGGVKVKNLPDCNPDKPEGKAAKTSRQGGWMKKPESPSGKCDAERKEHCKHAHAHLWHYRQTLTYALIRTRSTTQTCIS